MSTNNPDIGIVVLGIGGTGGRPFVVYTSAMLN